MAIKGLDKLAIDRYLTQTGSDNLDYWDLTNAFTGRGYKLNDYLGFLIERVEKYKGDEKQSALFNKCMILIDQLRKNGAGETFDDRINDLKGIEKPEESKKDCSTDETTQNKIKDLQKRIEDLQREIEKLKKEIQSKDKSIDKLKATNATIKNNLNVTRDAKNELKNKNADLKSELKQVKEEKAKLQAQLDSVSSQLSFLSSIYKELLDSLKILQEETNSLKPNLLKAEELESAHQIIVTLRSELDDLAKLRQELDNCKDTVDKLKKVLEEQENEKEIVAGIIQTLFTRPVALNSLRPEPTTNDIEMMRYLQLASKDVSISSTMIKDGQRYFGITPPTIKSNENFSIYVPDNGPLDILWTADYHIRDSEHNHEVFLGAYDAVLGYCSANRINTIINLGDFFEFLSSSERATYDEYKKYRDITLKMAEDIPYLPNTNHIIMGGNHDTDNLKLGVDFLELFASSRSDSIIIGYETAYISFISSTGRVLGLFALSHSKEQLNRNHLDQRVSTICDPITSDKVNMFYLGHSHESYLDIDYNVCAVPSLTLDNNKYGAWHVKMFFDARGIAKMYFKPLDFKESAGLSKKLVPVTTIVYPKR